MLAITILTILFYPSFKEMTGINALVENDNSAMRVFVGNVTDLTSPEGYLNSQLYYLLIPLLFLVLAITQGSGAIAGEEERGSLDLILSNPVKRWQLALQKFGAMTISLMSIALILWIGTVTSIRLVSMEIAIINLAEITLSVTFLAILFGTIALTIGMSTGSRGISIGLTGAIAVLAYLINALVPIKEELHSLTKLSPFYYYIDSDPLTHGLDFLHVVVLIGLSVIIFLVGLFIFERRDLGL